MVRAPAAGRAEIAVTSKAKTAKRTVRRTPGRNGKAGKGRKALAPRPKRPLHAKRPERAAKWPERVAKRPERVVPAAPRARPADGPDAARPTALAIAKAALDKQAEDVTVLDVRGLTSYADYFVVMTADSDRQASAIADHVEQTMKSLGVPKVGVEGYESGRWILVDYGDVVAHVMNKESRGFYDLEGLWADAPRFQVEG